MGNEESRHQTEGAGAMASGEPGDTASASGGDFLQELGRELGRALTESAEKYVTDAFEAPHRRRTMNYALNRIFADRVTISEAERKRNTKYVKEKVDPVMAYIQENSNLFRADLRCVGSAYQGFKVGAADEYDYNLPLRLSHDACAFTDCDRMWGGFYGFNDRYRNQEMTLATLPDDCEVVTRGVPLLTPTANFIKTVNDIAEMFRGAGEEGSSARGARPRTPPPEVEQPLKQPRDVGPGYYWVSLVAERDKRRAESVTFGSCHHIVPYLVRRELHRLLVTAVRDLRLGDAVSVKKRHNWPALTLNVNGPGGEFVASVDFTPVIPEDRLDKALPTGASLPRPGKEWPPASEARAGPVNLVAMRPFYWQVSYAEAEKELASGLDADGGCRKKAHRIMKEINKTVWCPTTSCAVSSYMLKNLLFWECERHPGREHWEQERLWDRVQAMTKELLAALGPDGRLPQFFDPRVNLVEQRDQEECRIARGKVARFLEKPMETLAKAYPDLGLHGV